MRVFPIVCCCLSLQSACAQMAVQASTSVDGNGLAANASPAKIQTGEQAIAVSRRVVGAAAGSAEAIAAEVDFDKLLPFLSSEYSGQRVWKVTLKDVKFALQLKAGEGEFNYDRTYYTRPYAVSVYLEPMKGGILLIETDWPSDQEAIPQVKSSDAATSAISLSGDEKWTSVCVGAPAQSLSDVVQVVMKTGLGGGVIVDQYRVYVVAVTRLGITHKLGESAGKPQLMWSVEELGYPSDEGPIGGPPSSRDRKTKRLAHDHRMRHLIRDSDRTWIFANNEPQPERPPKANETATDRSDPAEKTNPKQEGK